MSKSRFGKRWWLASALALGLVLGVAVVAGVLRHNAALSRARVGETGKPLLRVDRDLIDLGQVPLGQWVEAKFLLTNAGDGRLRLAGAPYVRAVAGC